MKFEKGEQKVQEKGRFSGRSCQKDHGTHFTICATEIVDWQLFLSRWLAQSHVGGRS